MNSKLFQSLIVLSLLLVSATSFAQGAATTKFVPDQKELDVQPIDNIDARRGLDGTLSGSININLVHNKDMVGQLDGLSTIFGIGIVGGLDWIHGRHEVRNTLRIDESWARTPVLAQFVKNNDLISLASQYNYFFLDWMGAFGRLSFETSLFPTNDTRTEKYTYNIDNGKRKVSGNSIKIAGSFHPFSMAQSLGIVADPLRTDFLSISARLGVGGRETLADGVLSIGTVDDTAKTIAVTTLSNVYQFGVEGFVGGTGKFQDGRISYDFGLSVLIPFVNNAPVVSGKKRGAFELTRIGAGGSVNFAVFSWMGISYKLFFLNDPQLLDKAQIQNSILATFNYTFIDRKNSTTATEEEVAAAQAEAEKEAAEKRAKEDEARIAQLEKEKEEATKAAEAAKAQAEAAKNAPANAPAEKAPEAAPEEPAAPTPTPAPTPAAPASN